MSGAQLNKDSEALLFARLGEIMNPEELMEFMGKPQFDAIVDAVAKGLLFKIERQPDRIFNVTIRY